MPEYFVVANSFAAPFFSDTSNHYMIGPDPITTLIGFAADYKHPCGLFSAVCYASADAYHKNEAPLAKWLSNHEQEKQRLTAGLGAYSFMGHGPGHFEINGRHHYVHNPTGGGIVAQDKPHS